MKEFIFYLKYYLTNHVVNRIPIHRFRLFWYRKMMKVQIGKSSQLFMNLTFYGNSIHKVQIGQNSIINPGCLFNASDSIFIGDHVVLAHQVSLHTADHDIHDCHFSMRTAPIHIKDGAWIASHAILLKGITIGKGAVVAAGAVVTHSVNDDDVVAGNPARVIGHRRATEVQIVAGNHPLFC